MSASESAATQTEAAEAAEAESGQAATHEAEVEAAPEDEAREEAGPAEAGAAEPEEEAPREAVREQLEEAGPAEAAPENAEPEDSPEEREPEAVVSHDARQWRAIITVGVVTVVLVLLFNRFGGFFSRQSEIPGPADSLSSSAAPATVSAPGEGPPTAAPARPPAGAPSGTAEIAGRTIRGDSGGAVAGAIVIAVGPSGPISTTSDEQGTWRFTGLQAGTYTIVGTVPSFSAEQIDVEAADSVPITDVVITLAPESDTGA
jgi:hypothetical protein